MIMRVSQGAVSTIINALTSDLRQDDRARAFNVLHGIYSVGAALSPLLIALVLRWGQDWRVIFLGAAAIWFVYGVSALWFDYPEQSGSVAKRQLLSVAF